MTGASICVLTLDKYEATERCLRSVLRTALDAQTELIVVDNGSRDGTVAELLALQQRPRQAEWKMTVVANGENRGCGGGRNIAAALATKPYLVFLDNDVEIEDPLWLSKTITFLANDASCGIMGGKLVHAERPRRLQAAGVRVDADANVSYVGDGADPSDVAHASVAQVQGVAGACLALKTALFREMGGFDEIYNPVNYEDLDLCYKVKQSGLRILYNPAVEIFHKAHTTTHNTPGLPIRRVSLNNQRVFRDRWKTVLQQECAAQDG